MFTVEFYEKANGESELWDFLENLRVKSSTTKDARIRFVLLHQFRKKSQKTPRREIDKAKAERDDYLARKETDK
jgi:hypothetical protein